MSESVRDIAIRARLAARKVMNLDSRRKDAALKAIAAGLRAAKAELQAENVKDLENGRANGLSAAMLDRLSLSDKVIEGMAKALEEIAELPDPVGRINDMQRRPNGLLVGRMRIPLGVVAMIYEARPNVTSDAAGLCLKSGNAVILRGGSEAFNSNLAIVKLIQRVLVEQDISADAVCFIPVTDRAAVNELLKLEDLIDVVIPRGGEGLIRAVSENSRIPVLKHYNGICHIYVDRDADFEKAFKICLNAKVQRPGTCNALETLLVDAAVADMFLPEMIRRLKAAGVEIRGCERTCAIVADVVAATDSDWPAEFLDLILAVKVVDGLDAAIDHIETYSSNHTESIITENYTRAMEFLRQVDSSSVMVNASTRLADGGEYGLGAEVGISTSKLHAYGPMGIEGLTAEKFVCFGDGQIRE